MHGNMTTTNIVLKSSSQSSFNVVNIEDTQPTLCETQSSNQMTITRFNFCLYLLITLTVFTGLTVELINKLKINKIKSIIPTILIQRQSKSLGTFLGFAGSTTPLRLNFVSQFVEVTSLVTKS